MKTVFSRIDEDENARPKAGIAGFLVSLVAGPRIGDHLELGLEAGLLPAEPQLEETEVEAGRIPIYLAHKNPSKV
jgi:hypothetical protein